MEHTLKLLPFSLFNKQQVQWCALENQQSPFYVVNEVALTGQKPILKILLASWTFDTVRKRFISFNTENLGSVGQRTAKLLAIKLYE